MKKKKKKVREDIKKSEKSWQGILIINDLAIHLTFLVSKAIAKWGPNSYFYRALLMSILQEKQSFVIIVSPKASIHVGFVIRDTQCPCRF